MTDRKWPQSEEKKRYLYVTEQKKWRICVYIRLSKEDTREISRQEKNELQIKSESIKNQKSILTTWIGEYFKAGTYDILDFFEDDGMTGTDDEREGFRRMLKALEKGEGNCVVVKNLSRAFRNYADQGYYLEEYFPSRNIRFISTMDSFIDTYKDKEAVYNLDIPMYGVLNDRFAASTSRAVRRTFDDKRAKGKFIGAFPPWGFLKDPADKNHLILDPDTAPVKVQMKDWLLYEGISLNGVARRLNAMGIPNPAEYKRRKGWKYANPHVQDNNGLWSGKSVKEVMLNLMNAGHMVQGKQRVVSYKIHDKISVPKEEWYIVENTHEPTFSQEEFQALCILLKRNTRMTNSSARVHKFAGLIRCGCCKKAMHRSHGKGRVYFKCRTNSMGAENACRVKSIRQDRLERAVLAAIQAQIWLTDFPTAAEVLKKPEAKQRLLEWKKLLACKERERKKIQNISDSLYGSWKTGKLSWEEYRRMKARYEKEAEQAEEALEKIKEEINCLDETGKEKNALLEEFLKNRNITVLTRAVLLAFVDVIYVYENNEIDIHFKIQDELSGNGELRSGDAPN